MSVQSQFDKSANNKRIAKNTILLYIRMLLLMFISLYTSRVILNSLGVEDYGIYGVVGGLVTMFSVLSGSLNAAISRFLTFELGKGDKKKTIAVFRTSILIQLILSIIILILAETIGLWFLNNKMVIPHDRLIASNWCFQFTIITFCFNLLSVPFNSAIIAHEKMSAYAYIGVFEAIGRLCIALSIAFCHHDRLILYSVYIAVFAVIVQLVYMIYGKRNFDEVSFLPIFKKDVLKEMFGFAGWNFIGAAAGVIRDQGGNLLINIYFGPTVNAARTIAMKINASVMQFAMNFTTALNPQITKSFANNNKEYTHELVFQGARFSSFMLLLISLPILIHTSFILRIWLGVVPEYTVILTRLTIINAIIEALSYPLVTVMLATGKIRNYQIIVGGMLLLNLPLSYILLELGSQPESILIVSIIISHFCLLLRLYLLKNMVGIPSIDFLKKVYLKTIVVTLTSLIPSLTSFYLITNQVVNFIVTTFITLLSTSLSIYILGCTPSERHFIISKFFKKKKNYADKDHR